ncbi:hypothetical protein EVAR_98357_1 [Eumeta japonica]|uniref:Uncharacterized protein n=1 Tax=Eumeta variegata TaxID=151549 RepID=A0A4C2ABH8_EUMVA|nr:hypothetical protein EVAR_98357_1 [Eumeta japonica]
MDEKTGKLEQRLRLKSSLNAAGASLLGALAPTASQGAARPVQNDPRNYCSCPLVFSSSFGVGGEATPLVESGTAGEETLSSGDRVLDVAAWDLLEDGGAGQGRGLPFVTGGPRIVRLDNLEDCLIGAVVVIPPVALGSWIRFPHKTNIYLLD